MSEPLPNARHERFAQELAKGKSATEAYEAAGYKPNRQHAHRLVTKGDVAARVRDLQRIAAKQTTVTIETLTAMFLADREFARLKENPAAALQASAHLAKLHGYTLDGKGREMLAAEMAGMLRAGQPAEEPAPPKPEPESVVVWDVEEMRRRYGVVGKKAAAGGGG